MQYMTQSFSPPPLFENILPRITAQCGVMEDVEAVVVAQRHVGIVVEQDRQNVVALLRDGIVQRRLSVTVLRGQKRRGRKRNQ